MWPQVALDELKEDDWNQQEPEVKTPREERCCRRGQGHYVQMPCTTEK